MKGRIRNPKENSSKNRKYLGNYNKVGSHRPITRKPVYFSSDVVCVCVCVSVCVCVCVCVYVCQCMYTQGENIRTANPHTMLSTCQAALFTMCMKRFRECFTVFVVPIP